MRLTRILDEFEIKRTDVDFWMREGVLRTSYADTVSGRPRQFSRANAVELAAMARLNFAGADYRKAAVWAELIVNNYTHYRNGIGPRFRWYVSPLGNFGDVTEAHHVTNEVLERALVASKAGCVFILDMIGLFDRVDALFDEGER